MVSTGRLVSPRRWPPRSRRSTRSSGSCCHRCPRSPSATSTGPRRRKRTRRRWPRGGRPDGGRPDGRARDPGRRPPIPSVADIVDLPTEAGMPVFGDEDDEVAWMRARSTPPPPPPPFDEPPVRPLFAPEPPEGAPARRPRTDLSRSARPTDAPLAAAGFWPWDTGAGIPGGNGGNGEDGTAEHEAVPGRSWLRLAMVLAACLALLIGVAVAFNLGRGRTPLGAERDEPTTSPTLTTPAEPTASPLADVVASAFDPLGTDGGFENDEDVRTGRRRRPRDELVDLDVRRPARSSAAGAQVRRRDLPRPGRGPRGGGRRPRPGGRADGGAALRERPALRTAHRPASRSLRAPPRRLTSRSSRSHPTGPGQR